MVKINWELLLLDIIFLIGIVYGLYKSFYEPNHRVLIFWFSLSLLATVVYRHCKLYKNLERMY